MRPRGADGPRKGAEVFLATPRIQKPGEDVHFQKIADAQPDGILVRNLGGVAFCVAAADSLRDRYAA